MSIAEIGIATGITLLLFACAIARYEYRFGVSVRRNNGFIGLGWSVFARRGWHAEDRRRRKLR